MISLKIRHGYNRRRVAEVYRLIENRDNKKNYQIKLDEQLAMYDIFDSHTATRNGNYSIAKSFVPCHSYTTYKLIY